MSTQHGGLSFRRWVRVVCPAQQSHPCPSRGTSSGGLLPAAPGISPWGAAAGRGVRTARLGCARLGRSRLGRSRLGCSRLGHSRLGRSRRRLACPSRHRVPFSRPWRLAEPGARRPLPERLHVRPRSFAPGDADPRDPAAARSAGFPFSLASFVYTSPFGSLSPPRAASRLSHHGVGPARLSPRSALSQQGLGSFGSG